MKLGLKQFAHDLRNRRYRFRQVIGVAFMLFIAFRADPTQWLLWVGIPVAAFGAFIRLWAAGYLRKSKELETQGPYSFVRHPQYLGNTFLAFGICLASGHPIAILVWPLILYLFYKPAIEREDDKMHRRFGKEWETWKTKTPPLVPINLHRIVLGIYDLNDWSIIRAFKNGEIVWCALFIGIALFIIASSDEIEFLF